MSACTLITTAVLISCSTPAKKVENAENNVAEANVELEKANKEYLADIENYRKEADDKIIANQASIAEFNTRIEHEKKDAKADYKKRVAEFQLTKEEESFKEPISVASIRFTYA